MELDGRVIWDNYSGEERWHPSQGKAMLEIIDEVGVGFGEIVFVKERSKSSDIVRTDNFLENVGELMERWNEGGATMNER